LRAVAEPFEYDEYKKAKIKEKIEKQAEGRIAAKKKMPKVNAKMATRILQEESTKTSGLLTDERFRSLWENEDFKVDEEDDKYKLYHPVPKVCNILY
jgi:ribosome biogenesis protein ENP2